MNPERFYTLKPDNNPNHIELYYETKGDFVTVTLNLKASKFELTHEEMTAISELPIQRSTSIINNKKAVLKLLRDNLLDAMDVILGILAIHTIAEKTNET